MSSRISKLNLENKFFPIFSNSKSTIQVPPNCKKLNNFKF